MKKIFQLEWDNELGEGWMNIFNLELCLFSKEHTKRESLRVREIAHKSHKPIPKKEGKDEV